ncbi:Mu transposase domain-containing protein [Streptomyces griseofuscus]|uniref:Mu transposase domain-containing protein n=1 Tax=Streptomyces griseofuscus TaxID=146922 RepID=UPI003F5161D5
MVAFDGNLYSVPARRVRPRQLVEIRATKSQVALHATLAIAGASTLLATHLRAGRPRSPRRRRDALGWPAHREGTPDHHRRHPPSAASRAASGPGSQSAAGPVEPDRRHSGRGRPPTVVGL